MGLGKSRLIKGFAFIALLLICDKVQAADLLIARLSFPVGADQISAFEIEYDQKISPILKRHGWVLATLDRPVSKSNLGRYFAFRDTIEKRMKWDALWADSEWESLRIALANRFGRGDHKGRIKYYLRTVQVPAGKGKTVPVKAGQKVIAASGLGFWRNYDATDGLPVGTIRSIVQDRLGYLWLASNNGIGRFDGQTFRLYNQKDGLAGRTVYAMAEDQKGDLWIGSWGRGVSRYDGEKFTQYTKKDGLSSNIVWAIRADSKGRIWFGADFGVSWYDGEQFQAIDDVQMWGISAICEDDTGVMWFGTHGRVFCYDGQDVTVLTEADGLPRSTIYAIAQDHNKQMWFGTRDGLVKYDASAEPHKRFTLFTEADGLSSNVIRSLFVDRDGDLWIGTGRELSLYDGHTFTTFTTADGLGGRGVWAIYQDREENLWFGMGGAVSQFSKHNFTTFRQAQGLAGNSTRTIVPDQNGHLWFGSVGGITRYDPSDSLNTGSETFTQFTAEDGLVSDDIQTGFRDHDGDLWFGSWDKGVTRYDGKSFTTFTEEDGLAHNIVTSIAQAHDGAMWFGGSFRETGVSRYDGRQFQTFRAHDGLSDDLVWRVFEDSKGGIWFGTNNGLNLYDGQQFEAYSPEQGLVSEDIGMIFESNSGDLWFGGRLEGVSRYDGSRFVTWTSQDGLGGGRVLSMFEDDKGHLWFATSGGATRYDGRVFQTLTQKDGLAHNIVQQVYQDEDRAYWFATVNGVTRFRQPKPYAPTVQINAVLAGRRYGDVKEQLEIPSTIDLVAFEYSSMSFKTRPEAMIYRYRLKGYDNDWQTTHNRRVEYPDLPTGAYTFEVQAVDRDLVYSETPAVLGLTVHLPYERIGLWSALGIALVLVIGQTVRVIRRDQRLKETQAQLIEEMEKELQAAHDMQMGLMPAGPPQLEGVEMSGVCIPAREVGGDYYTFLEDFGDEKVGFVVADVSGKGMQAATIVMRFNEMLIYEASGDRSVNEILNGLDSSLRKRTPPEMFATCGIGVLDLKKKSLSFDSAACPEVYHYQAEDQSVQSLGISGLPLGMALDIPDKVFGHVDLSLSSGDVLVFTSDGVEEAQTLERDFYGEERLAELVNQCGREGMSAEAIRDRVVTDVVSFVGEAPQTDDLTVVVLKVL